MTGPSRTCVCSNNSSVEVEEVAGTRSELMSCFMSRQSQLDKMNGDESRAVVAVGVGTWAGAGVMLGRGVIEPVM